MVEVCVELLVVTMARNYVLTICVLGTHLLVPILKQSPVGDPNDLVPIHKRQGDYLTHWKSIEALRLLNLVYDVTSPDLITMVITQVGLIPCTSVPVVLRISRDLEQMQTT